MNANPIRQPSAPDPVEVRVHRRRQKYLGEWTTARRFAVEATDSLVVVDLLLPNLAPGDIEVDLDIDHSTLKLLVPDGAVVDENGLRRIGRGQVKDRTGTSSATGRRIVLSGEMRHSEVRVHRGGIALLSLLPSHLRDLRRVHTDGRLEGLVSAGSDAR